MKKVNQKVTFIESPTQANIISLSVINTRARLVLSPSSYNSYFYDT